MRFPQIPRTGLQLRDIFKEAYFADPRRSLRRDDDPTPLEFMSRGSQGLDLARQYLPRVLGGYGPGRMQEFDSLRNHNSAIRENTLRAGEYPVLDGTTPQQGIAAEAARRVAQAAGALAADTTSQGALNIWWFINAAESAAMAAGQQAMHGALGRNKLLRQEAIEGAPTGTPISRGPLRVAATFPLILGAGAATGTLFRQPGYAAVLPSEEDRTESADPVAERLLRTIGRTGGLLPYDEFVEERPDVSRGEYESYKAYLHGNKSPIKATADGIHGPEVTFLGKSLPLLTGILPIVGGIVGGRAGLRVAGARLAKGINEFKTLSRLDDEVGRLKAELRRPDIDDYTQAQIEEVDLPAAIKAHKQQQDKVDGSLLSGAILGSSAGLGITAAGAALLEQIRRAKNLEENRRNGEQFDAVPAVRGS